MLGAGVDFGHVSDSIGCLTAWSCPRRLADPTITVSGPTTRDVDQAGNYSATAFNCSANANGWNWSATGGGTITGDTNSDEVSISWSTGGVKTVTASNSGCGSVTGSLNVTVSSPSIAITGPTSRLVGQPGDYTASVEDCLPAANGWSWNATGGGSITGNTSSSAVTITWGTQGTEIVTATNSACDPAQGVLFVTVAVAESMIFADGFESGDTSAW